MDADSLFYVTGEEVHAGDRVQFKGDYADVVFVSTGDHEEFMPGYEDYIGGDPGIIICDDDGTVSDLGLPSEALEFISRG